MNPLASEFFAAMQDLLLDGDPHPRANDPAVMFEIGKTYATRAVFCRDGDVRHQSATVVGQVNDHMGRLWLVVHYSDGRSGQVLANGTSGLGHPHATDLVLA